MQNINITESCSLQQDNEGPYVELISNIHAEFGGYSTSVSVDTTLRNVPYDDTYVELMGLDGAMYSLGYILKRIGSIAENISAYNTADIIWNQDKKMGFRIKKNKLQIVGHRGNLIISDQVVIVGFLNRFRNLINKGVELLESASML